LPWRSRARISRVILSYEIGDLTEDNIRKRNGIAPGKSRLASIAMTAQTTSSSINVNPLPTWVEASSHSAEQHRHCMILVCITDYGLNYHLRVRS
jgi:hypothetical protein